jgi:hypothetical protein
MTAAMTLKRLGMSGQTPIALDRRPWLVKGVCFVLDIDRK